MKRTHIKHIGTILGCVLLLVGVKSFGDDADQVAAPSTVTIHMEGVHPHDVMDELTKQTGVAFAVWPDQLYQQNQQLPTSITLNLDQATFWTAVGAMCEGAHLQPWNFNNSGAITFQQSDGHEPFGKRPQSAGPMGTIVVDSIQRNHSISFRDDDPQVQRNCGVEIKAFVDPRVRMMKFQNQANVDTAEDENGESIVVAPGNATPNFQDSQTKWEIQGLNIPLNYDPEKSHKLATLKGSVRVMVASDVAKIEFDDLANAAGTDKEEGGLKVIVDDVKENEHSTEVKVRIMRTEMSKENFRNIFGKIFQDGRFESAGGKEMRPGGGGGGGEDLLQYTLNANYSGEGDKPVKLIWEIPTQTQQIDLPFEFHDLTLP
jgi:hypothetical protein